MFDMTPCGQVSREFQALWTLAASYIERLGEGELSWFKGKLSTPLLEHFSFRLGNQLFFVRLEDSEGRLVAPGSMAGLLEISEACAGVPLLMPMRNTGGIWLPAVPGWGLVDARTREPVDPRSLVTREKIPYTDWELHDAAVRAVIRSLGGRAILGSSPHPSVSPSVWYRGETGSEWVMVRAARRAEAEVRPPANWAQIREACVERGSGNGFFAVAVFAARDPETGKASDSLPLCRGSELVPRLIQAQVYRRPLPEEDGGRELLRAREPGAAGLAERAAPGAPAGAEAASLGALPEGGAAAPQAAAECA
ncbi:MAG: hypothetical protein LBW85_03870 [Deltaproteobacteria bacterium]|jgi:hypothetical protein|nr:hypothetical protein [Deltaproteobacteria bacterium]